MFHCNGWCFTWAVTAVGGPHVCLRKVDPARIWELLESEGVTHFNGAPTVHIGVVNDPTPPGGWSGRSRSRWPARRPRRRCSASWRS